LQGILVLLVSFAIGFHLEHPLVLFPAVLFMFLVALFFTLLGTSIATLIKEMEAFPLIMNFLIMPLFFLSGALFPLEGLPLSIRFLAQINPLSYGVDGLRILLGGEAHFGLGTDMIVLGILTLVMLVVGSRLFGRIEV